MARILFTVWPFAGHVHPGLAVAHALAARGHEVAFYSGSSVRETVEREGFRFFPFQAVDEEKVIATASADFPYRATWWGRLGDLPRLRAKFKAWLLDTVPQQVEDLEAHLAGWNADIVVTDLAFWGPILVLRDQRRLPVAVLSILAACLLPGPDAPFWGAGSAKPRTAAARLASRGLAGLARVLARGMIAHANAIRARYGLSAISVPVTEYAARMPLYLVPSVPEYDYNRRDLPPTVHYVGPCLWDKPRTARAPAWLSNLPAEKPLVYVTEATVGRGEPFLLRAAARGLADLPVEVIMTTGQQRDPAELRTGAPNMRVEAYVPISDLLPRMSVMVTLGGSGGVLSALSAGVPLVVVPTEWDRPENAQRVVEAGAGLRLAAETCTPERLRAAVERVLGEPRFGENARRLARAMARYRGPDRAAELIEGLVAAEVPVPAGQGRSEF